jgi:hypothetical protein
MLGEYNAGWFRSKLGIRILVDRRAAGLGILAARCITRLADEVHLLGLNCLLGLKAPGPGERIVTLAYNNHIEKVDRPPNRQRGYDQQTADNGGDLAFGVVVRH